MDSQHLLIGVDIGATKIAAGLGCHDGSILRQHVVSTVREDPDLLANQVCDLIATLFRDDETRCVGRPVVGIGICGQVEPTSGVVRSPIALGWPMPVPLRDMVQLRTGLDVHIDNDVNAGALGEMMWGTARGLSNFVYVSVGTGIGAGIVINGRLLRGAHHAAGEIGHLVIDMHGPVCSCGNRGCLEVLAGGRDLALWATDALASSTEGQASALGEKARLGEVITARDIFQAAAGDAFSLNVVRTVGEYLAVAVMNLVNLLDPEKIIIGGGLTRDSSLLMVSLKEGLKKWKALLADVSSVLCLSTLVQNNGIAGAMGVALVGSGGSARTTRLSAYGPPSTLTTAEEG